MPDEQQKAEESEVESRSSYGDAVDVESDDDVEAHVRHGSIRMDSPSHG